MQIKELIFAGAERTGILTLTRTSEWRRRRLLILCYHGVATLDEHEWNGELYVPPELLRRRLRHLREHDYTVLPLAEACRRLAAGTLPHRSVALTFDDGAADFATEAVPILREFDAPATVYLTTYYSEVRLPVFDTILSYVLWRGRDSGADVGHLCESTTPLPTGTEPERDAAWNALSAYAIARGFDALAKDALVRAVADCVDVSYSAVLASGVLQIMPPDVVASLPPNLIDVQLHTHRHRTPLDRALFLRELRDNAARIRAVTGGREALTHFCYPSGVYESSFLPWLREAGVAYATTCVPGIASAADNPLLLPRLIDTAARSATGFEAWASGFAALLPKRRAHRLDYDRLHST
jgi:peptidoglycan/xylan/chitin deacetylase (PgdA/CDA1 family)